MEKISLILVAVVTPIKFGLYKNRELFKEIESNKKVSEAILEIFSEILKEYEIEAIYFAKGPGSFMALKLQYIFLKTLQITLNIPLKAVDSFYFFPQKIIFCTKNLAFIKHNEDIVTKKVTELGSKNNIVLPRILIESDFSDDLEPFYLLPAV